MNWIIGVKPPCGKHCAERSAGCHGKCERYREYKTKCDAERAERERERKLMDDITAVATKPGHRRRR